MDSEGSDDDVRMLAAAQISDTDGTVAYLAVQLFGPESWVRLNNITPIHVQCFRKYAKFIQRTTLNTNS